MHAPSPARGFSLLELMIVVAIIAILASLALPRYQTYVGRAQAAEAVNLLAAMKTPVLEYAAENAACPHNGEGGIASASGLGGRYVASIEAAGDYPDCALTATFKDSGISAPLKGGRITLTAHLNEDQQTSDTQWSCASDLDARYLAAQCTAEAQAQD